MGSSSAENKLPSHGLQIIRHELIVVDVNFTKLLHSIFIYLFGSRMKLAAHSFPAMAAISAD